MAESLAEFFLTNFRADRKERAYGQRCGYRMEWFTYGQVLELAVDADSVYFTTDGSGGMGLYSVPVAGGNVSTLLSGEPRVDLLTQDGDYLFFTGKDGAYRLRKPGR